MKRSSMQRSETSTICEMPKGGASIHGFKNLSLYKFIKRESYIYLAAEDFALLIFHQVEEDQGESRHGGTNACNIKEFTERDPKKSERNPINIRDT